MGISSQSLYAHSAFYARDRELNRQVKQIHEALVQSLDQASIHQEPTCFLKALDELEHISAESVRNLFTPDEEALLKTGSLLPTFSGRVHQELLWIITHPRAQTAIMLKLTERLKQELAHRSHPSETSRCYELFRKRCSEIHQLQDELVQDTFARAELRIARSNAFAAKEG